MWQHILVGFVLVGVTVAIHSVGTLSLMRWLIRKYAGHDGLWRSHQRIAVFVQTAVALLSLHMVEIFTWAIAYLLLSKVTLIHTLEGAVYFSLITFTTLGYGDITLPTDVRILSGIEAMSGIFVFGWSTALFFAVMQRAFTTRKDKPSGAGGHQGPRSASRTTASVADISRYSRTAGSGGSGISTAAMGPIWMVPAYNANS